MKKIDYITTDTHVIVTKDYYFKYGVIGACSKFNGYTVPKWLHWFHKPLEGELTPAIIHDYLLFKRNPNAHRVFRDALKTFDFHPVKRQLMFLAVVVYQRVKYPNLFK